MSPFTHMTAFLLFAIVAATSVTCSPPALNNIGYLGYGYNQFTGNPHDDGFDPGLTVPVFNTTIYAKKKTNIDRSFSIPDGVDAHRASSCNSASVSKEILDENDLTDILRNSFEAHFTGVPFSANAKYQRIKKQCRQNRDVFVESVSTCEQYAARILMYDQPPLTEDFLSAVAELPTEFKDNAEAFINFLKNFGTHVVTKVWMGSKLIRTYGMSGSEFAELLGLGFNIKLAATIHTGSAMGKFRIKSALERSQELQSFLEQHLVVEDLIGTTEDASSDFVDKWYPMQLNEPSPVRYSLTKMSEFVDKDKQDAVEEAISQFCHYINAQCEPEEPLPQPVPICPSVKFHLDKTKRTAPCTYGVSVLQQDHPKLVCPNDYVLTGVQLSVGKTFGHLRFNVGCSTRLDISLDPVDWVSPVPAPDKFKDGSRRSLVSCPEGHFASGISFVRNCVPSSGANTFASLQCSRSSQTIRQTSFTEWSDLPIPSTPLYTYLACHDGGIVCGIEFRGQKDASWANQAYRLQCCYVGSKCLSRYPAPKSEAQFPALPSESTAIAHPAIPNEETEFYSARASVDDTEAPFYSARMHVDLGNVQFYSSRYFDVKDAIIEQSEGEMEDAESFLSDELLHGEITIESNKFNSDFFGWQ